MKNNLIHNRALTRSRAATYLGGVLEWYDFAIYSYFAPLLAALYFPADTPRVELLKIFSLFAIGFMVRPIGALFFGYLGDRYGRAFSLKITPLLIMCPTALLGILPTYEQIGYWAPCLLLFIRLVQGFCIGGEFAGNIVYLCESSPSKRHYFWGSIGASTGSLGILVGSCVAAILYSSCSGPFLVSIGWRIAFLASIPAGLFIFKMRKKLLESYVFEHIIKKHPPLNPLIVSWQTQKKVCFMALGLLFFPATAFYFIFTFLPNYVSAYLGFDAGNVLSDNSFSLLIRLLIIPVIGLCADRWGGITILRIACLAFLISSIPLFWVLVHFHEPAALYIFAILSTLGAGAIPGVLVKLLSPATRCTTFSFIFNLGYGVFGGLTPLIGFLLAERFNGILTPVSYLLFSAIITLIVSFKIGSEQFHG